MKKEIILKLIQEAGSEFYVTGSASNEQINHIEASLGIKLPTSYVWYLKEYGSGGIAGSNILGVSKNNIIKCLDETKYRRGNGFPDRYLVIYNAGEYLYCLDTEHYSEDECPVVLWDLNSANCRPYKKNFYEFLQEQFELALEDLAD